MLSAEVTMQIYPAIDIKDGKCVRLFKGKMEEVTIFSDDPVEMAGKWEAAGARFLHVVDLDGAVEGAPQNLEIVRAMARSIGIPIQLGGGIRDLRAIQEAMQAGVRRVILGTIAVKDPAFLEDVVRLHSDAIVVGIDARDGKVSVGGWIEDTPLEAIAVARRVEQLGVRRIIYTDIERDGTLIGPNLSGLRRLLESTGIPVIASGGISVASDIEKLKELGPLGLEGAIIGRALYVGTISLEDAIRLGGQ
jgi:phosphoribosylformimino-5-aminoimidazole carboxamide ribotide isomerase